MPSQLFTAISEKGLQNIQSVSQGAMEESRLSQFQETALQRLNHSRIRIQNEDQVAAHCKRQHLSPSPLDSRALRSQYHSAYSPSKSPNYNRPQEEKELGRFRKHENSTSVLPSILENSSHYQRAYPPGGKSMEKITRGKEKPSWFLKMNWALDPTSQYEKTYLHSDGGNVNEINKERLDHSRLKVFEGRESTKKSSVYRQSFQPLAIKREAVETIKDRDHLKNKENYGLEQSVSEYKRRYDSVIGLVRKESHLSFHEKRA